MRKNKTLSWLAAITPALCLLLTYTAPCRLWNQFLAASTVSVSLWWVFMLAGNRHTSVSDPPQRASCWLGQRGWRHDSGYTCRPHGTLTLITIVYNRKTIDSHSHVFCEPAPPPTCQTVETTIWSRLLSHEWQKFPPSWHFLAKCKVVFLFFYQCDIRDSSSLYKVCEEVDCIFHTASYGMSGPEQVTSLHVPLTICSPSNHSEKSQRNRDCSEDVHRVHEL